MEYRKIIVDIPRPKVQRITLNRPEKRNPLSNELRGELFHALESADNDPDIAVTIIRGAGECFSAGYDLKSNVAEGQPFHTAGGLGNWPRHVVDGFFRMWDLGKPVIAQVHGYCLAGGTELATACDLVYVARRREDRLPGRACDQSAGQPVLSVDRGAATRDGIDVDGGFDVGARRRRMWLRESCVCDAELEAQVLDIAQRVAKVPSDIQQINKRAVHRQMDAMGIRAGIRAGTEMQTLATFTRSTQAHLAELRNGLTEALTKRDKEFGDYRTTKK